jgi:hypothetical protein
MEQKVIYVDIDGCICTNALTDYTKASPYPWRIEKINKLYDEGYIIIYWTARGMTTGKDWKEVTEQQLKSWGAKYTEVRMGKPYYNLFIDDKAINSEFFF